jgi:hypothetical protein
METSDVKHRGGWIRGDITATSASKAPMFRSRSPTTHLRALTHEAPRPCRPGTATGGASAVPDVHRNTLADSSTATGSGSPADAARGGLWQLAGRPEPRSRPPCQARHGPGRLSTVDDDSSGVRGQMTARLRRSRRTTARRRRGIQPTGGRTRDTNRLAIWTATVPEGSTTGVPSGCQPPVDR